MQVLSSSPACATSTGLEIACQVILGDVHLEARWQLPLDPLEEDRVTRPCNEDLTRASNETTFSNEGFQKRSSNEASKNVRPDI